MSHASPDIFKMRMGLGKLRKRLLDRIRLCVHGLLVLLRLLLVLLLLPLGSVDDVLN